VLDDMFSLYGKPGLVFKTDGPAAADWPAKLDVTGYVFYDRLDRGLASVRN